MSETGYDMKNIFFSKCRYTIPQHNQSFGILKPHIEKHYIYRLTCKNTTEMLNDLLLN